MERSIREVNGSLLVAIPKEIAEQRGWRAGHRLSFSDDGEIVQLSLSPPADHVAFTIGYEGRDDVEFVRILQTAGVKQVIDVRERPMSRKPGFSKARLLRLLQESKIDYHHIGELGSPMPARAELRTSGDFNKFISDYKNHLANLIRRDVPAFNTLFYLVRLKVSAVMCFERDWRECHRSVLVNILERRGLTCRHL